jgi:hypothetical protein
VTLTLSGASSSAATTDGSGNYSFSGLASGNYTLTPSRSGCSFTPASQTITSLASSQTVNFAATMTASNTNLALGKAATQSSTYPGYPASLAVDGNTDGGVPHGSVTVSNAEATPWWQVDLGASAALSSIVVWNRTDCCGYRLADYWVFVSDTPFTSGDTLASLQSRAGTWGSHQTTAPNPSATIAASGVQGRYVRVQLSITDYMSLAEVQVFGH